MKFLAAVSILGFAAFSLIGAFAEAEPQIENGTQRGITQLETVL